MTQRAFPFETDGSGDGPSSGYADTAEALFYRFFCQNTNAGGVAPNVLNTLAVTGSSSPVSINTGQALVYGWFYANDASTTLAIPTPSVSTRIDRVVLQLSWSAKTIRIARHAGVEGGAAPSLTQTAGTTWEIPLYQASITTGGVITLTDEREYLAMLTTYGVNPRTHISGTNGIVVDPQNGNSRGADATDLQTLRSNVANVASGANSTIAGGEDNKAAAQYASVGGGYLNAVGNQQGTIAGGGSNTVNGGEGAVGGGSNNTAGAQSTVAGGTGNTASGDTASIMGGSTNTASGAGAAVLGGIGNTASAEYSTALGARAVASHKGELAHAHGRFAADGDAQQSRVTLRNSTSNNTQTELFIDGASLRYTIPSDTTWAFTILIVARRTDADNESAAYRIEGCIDNNAGTTALVGTIAKTVIAEDNAGWDVDAQADNTNDALVVKVTGENAKTIRWVAGIWAVQVTG